jgi:hypothetical protein
MKLKTKPTSVWLTLSSGGEVLYADMSMEESIKLLERHTTTKIKRGVAVEKIDRLAIAEETWSRKILDWRNMRDEDGNELPFSGDALLAVVNHDDDFPTEVAEAWEKYKEDQQRKQDELLKNSKSGDVGSLTTPSTVKSAKEPMLK